MHRHDRAKPTAVKRVLLDAAAGAVAGTVATIPMSAVMWTAQQAGLIRHQPPEAITEAALDGAGIRLPEQEEDKVTLANHLFFGAVAGTAYGGCHRALPPTAARVPAGIAFGLAVWASAYQGWVPALHIMPPADKDRPGRPQSMAVAHVVFGAALAVGVTRLRRS